MTFPRALAVLAAAAGVALGACSGTLYDPARIPTTNPSGLTCTPPTHACDDACVAQSTTQCGSSCATCAAHPPNATAACLPAGGDFACGYSCDPGLFACAAGCCRATDVAAGGNHSCAILDDGSLTCWGANDAGQLGVSTATASSQSPVRSLDGPGVSAVALGFRHTCAIQAGAVKCWGANEDGQLGTGSIGPGGPTPVPVSLAGATMLAAGTKHTCALVAGGAVTCWGWNAYGQLGIGSTSPDKLAPTPSLVTSSASAIGVRADTTCALVGAQVLCFGANPKGQIGNPAAADPQPTPDPATLPTTGGAAPTFIAVGSGHACAGLTPGGLFCWGDNSLSQLGSTSTATSSTTPIQADKIDNNRQAILAISGAAFTCSGKDRTGLKCAGANDQGQAGQPLSVSAEGDVTFGGNIISAGAGLDHGCVLVDLTPTGTPTPVVKCWGRNAEGQLGRSTNPAGSPDPSPLVVGP
jgi:alpha-tubulin suppressor-like RCC1 family protein